MLCAGYQILWQHVGGDLNSLFDLTCTDDDESLA